MDVVLSFFWWVIFGAIPTLLLLVPTFFVLKAKDAIGYWWYLSLSVLIGFIVYFFIGSIPFLVGELESASIEKVEMVKGGKPTLAWYLAKTQHSITGSIASAVFGSIWWFTLVRRRNA